MHVCLCAHLCDGKLLFSSSSFVVFHWQATIMGPVSSFGHNFIVQCIVDIQRYTGMVQVEEIGPCTVSLKA